MSSLSLQLVGRNFSLREKDFFENIAEQIQKGERAILWKKRKKYRLEVSKKAEEFVLRLVDLAGDKEIEQLRIKQNQELLDLEANLLTELTRSIERVVMQGALDIQRDFKDAQELAKKIDPEDKEFNEEYLKELRNEALQNLKDVARKRPRDK